MKLGAFSISLNVRDLQVSKDFYTKLGFEIFGGEMDQNYLIMKNGDSIVGLFQGMFEKNILTFNPGWDQECHELKDYSDVRELHRNIKAENIKTEQESLEGDGGPGSFFMTDPDGNPILIDQHI
jgi:catechol 2,3-dioxygenase-like lactoylglutathione lyase family enzyme